MRSIWTGSISFGLINIPVKLYAAVEDSTLNLDMLSAKDHSNIRFKRVSEKTGKEVPYDQIVKGYLYNDAYVILDKKDFEAADAVKTKTIEIQSFVLEEEIDSLYYEQPYYLEPDKSGAKAYGLLRDVLARTKKVGVTSFVMRNREALAILKPYEDVIVLNKIRFQEEIREAADLKVPPVSKARTKEQEMAMKLVDQLTEKFDISKFRDTYSDKLMALIKQKAKGKPIKPTRMKVVHKTTDDLMGMLKASLQKKKAA